MSAALFFVAQVETAPISGFPVTAIRASDLGYRSRQSDPGGIAVWPPGLLAAFAVDRKIALSPASAVVGASWGTLSIVNDGDQYSALVADYECAGLLANVYYGYKAFDAGRGFWVDPPLAGLQQAYVLVATPWLCNEVSLDVPLRDLSYWLEQPAQVAIYAGTGGLEGGDGTGGTVDLRDQTKPRARGGSAASPICQVPPLLVDALTLIYQYTDGPGTVVTLYEGGVAGGITYAGDVADLYTGTTPAGQYRTCNAKGLFQLGSLPQYAITIDCTGAFPTAGAQTDPAEIAYYVMTEDMGLSTLWVDKTSFDAAAAGYTAGWWWSSGGVSQTAATDPRTGAPRAGAKGVDAVGAVLAGLGAYVYPNRRGSLSLMTLPSPAAAAAAAVDAWDAGKLVSVTPRALPADLAPSPWRFRVGYEHYFQTTRSGFNPTLSAAEQGALMLADRFAVSTTAALDVSGSWTPNDPPPLVTALTSAADAASVAAALTATWSAPGGVPGKRQLFDCVVPLAIGLARELGDSVNITFPGVRGGATVAGVIVGEQFRSQDATMTFQVLI